MTEPITEESWPNSGITILSLARVHMWVTLQWNPKMVEFGKSETRRLHERLSFRDLVMNSEDLQTFRIDLLTIKPALERLTSGAAVLKRIKDVLIRTILLIDIGPDDKEQLEQLLIRRRRDRSDILERINGKQFFYFWFCESRRAISGKPNLPFALGALFGDGEEQVRDLIQAAHRVFREN